MLKILNNSTIFQEIETMKPDIVRKSTVLEIDFMVEDVGYEPLFGTRIKISVLTFYTIYQSKDSEPFDIASATRFFDIISNEEIQVEEIYSLALPVVKALREFVNSKGNPFKEKEFPLESPDRTKAKIERILREIEIDKSKINQFNFGLN